MISSEEAQLSPVVEEEIKLEPNLIETFIKFILDKDNLMFVLPLLPCLVAISRPLLQAQAQ